MPSRKKRRADAGAEGEEEAVKKIIPASRTPCPARPNSRALSSHVCISLETMSVSSPTPRAKSCVSSKIGVRISPKL